MNIRIFQSSQWRGRTRRRLKKGTKVGSKTRVHLERLQYHRHPGGEGLRAWEVNLIMWRSIPWLLLAVVFTACTNGSERRDQGLHAGDKPSEPRGGIDPTLVE